MADYISSYTGVQIENAVNKVLTGPILDDNLDLYAVGVPVGGSANLLNRKSGIQFNSSGNISCTNIYCNYIHTNATIDLGQANGGVTEGGEIQFLDSSNQQAGFIDTYRENASSDWKLRVCKTGVEFISVNLNKGNVRISNRNNNNAWIYCAQNAAIWSNIASTGGATGHLGMKTQAGRWALCTYNNERLFFTYCTDANVNAGTNTAGANIQFGENGKIYSASFGDYAENRRTNTSKPGTCVAEVGDGIMKETTERLQRGCHIVSDTFGMLIGPEEENSNPVALTGRALAYLYEDREIAKSHIGWPVCSGPNGTVSIMTEEEEQKYPSRIIGTISEIPDYEIWEEEVKVNGRIWINVR